MAMTLSLRTRVVVTASVSALVLVAGMAPAFASDPMPGSANDTVMSTGQAILVFIGIPLVVVALIYLLVSAPGWTRGGRASSADAWTSDPVVRGHDGTPGDAAIETSVAGTSDESGGTSASW